jgi:integrase
LKDPDTWTIPATRTKNHREHPVALSTQARKIITAQPHMAGCDYVFTAYGRGRVNSWHKNKTRLSKAAGIDEASWRLHDLRRTVASGLQRLGIRTEVIERALGHHSGSFAGVVGVYQVDPLADEVRHALQQWSDHVDCLAGGKPAKAGALRKRR